MNRDFKPSRSTYNIRLYYGDLLHSMLGSAPELDHIDVCLQILRANGVEPYDINYSVLYNTIIKGMGANIELASEVLQRTIIELGLCRIEVSMQIDYCP